MGLWRTQTALTLAVDLLYHVVDDMAVRVLRAEHDDFRVRVDLDVVPRWPIEEIIRFDSLLRALRVGGCWPRSTKPQ